jgi:hypothetical protein
MRRAHLLFPGVTAALLTGACRNGAGSEPAPPVPHVTPIDAHSAAERPVDDEPPTPRPSKEASGKDDSAFEGTTGATDKPRPAAKTAALRDVRTAQHEHFDRVVFEFEGDDLPGYHVEYIDAPVRQCGSGEVVDVAGKGWLAVRTTPAAAHDLAGKPTIPFRERKLKLGVVQELERTCDFEAEVTWVLGVSARNAYRVIELTKPPRLAIDVKH